MGKISKYSNLYDKDSNFLHKPGNYSIEELEELVDTLDKNSRETLENLQMPQQSLCTCMSKKVILIETNLYKSLLSSLKQRLPRLKL